MTNKYLKIDVFWLKIIAIITMTLDHIALLFLSPLLTVGSYNGIFIAYYILRSLGRLSLPIFCFLIVQGILHTNSKWKYLLRLGIEMVVISLGIFVLNLTTSQDIALTNIFIDLFLGALTLILLTLPGFKKLLAIMPFVLATTLCVLDYFAMLPAYLCMQYNYFSYLLILFFYISYLLFLRYSRRVSSKYGIDYEGYMLIEDYQKLSNIFAIGALIVINCICILMGYLVPNVLSVNSSFQATSLLAGIILFFYNGKKGYSKKWFQYGMYLYYPLHLAILYLIFLCI